MSSCNRIICCRSSAIALTTYMYQCNFISNKVIEVTSMNFSRSPEKKIIIVSKLRA